MKYCIILLLLAGCAIPPISRRDILARRIEKCMLKMADKGVEEGMLYVLCSKTHRPNKRSRHRVTRR